MSWVMGPGRTIAGVAGAAGLAGIVAIGVMSSHAESNREDSTADLVRVACQNKTLTNLWAPDSAQWDLAANATGELGRVEGTVTATGRDGSSVVFPLKCQGVVHDNESVGITFYRLA